MVTTSERSGLTTHPKYKPERTVPLKNFDGSTPKKQLVFRGRRIAEAALCE